MELISHKHKVEYSYFLDCNSHNAAMHCPQINFALSKLIVFFAFSCFRIYFLLVGENHAIHRYLNRHISS